MLHTKMRKSILALSLIFPCVALAQDEKLIVHAEVYSVTNIRGSAEDNVSELEDGTIGISNACGRYVAKAKVKEVLVGNFSEPEIEIHGAIGEWCRPVLDIFPSNYIFDLSKDPDGYLNLHHIVLYATSDDGLAAAPTSSDFAPESVTDVEFGYYHISSLSVPLDDFDDEYWEKFDQSWFMEDAGYMVLVKGVKYKSLREIITSNKSVPE